MPASRLADRRIREAASRAAPGLDVRGLVSEALGRAGITVPPLAEDDGEAPAATPAPVPFTKRRGARPAERVVKPFEPTPWPTRRARESEPPALSGLTPDERRVHQILLDALVLNSQSGLGDGTGTGGLSYLENKKLKSLDLAFINAEIAKMDGSGSATVQRSTVFSLLGLGLAMLGVGLSAGAGSSGFMIATGVMLLTVAAGVATGVIPSSFGPANAHRRKIYEALRELAILADPEDVTSDALRQADLVIDRLASPAAAAPDTTASAPRRRARS